MTSAEILSLEASNKALIINLKASQNQRLRLKEAAIWLGVSERTMHRYKDEQSAPCYKRGKFVEFVPSELKAWREAKSEKVQTVEEIKRKMEFKLLAK